METNPNPTLTSLGVCLLVFAIATAIAFRGAIPPELTTSGEVSEVTYTLDSSFNEGKYCFKLAGERYEFFIPATEGVDLNSLPKPGDLIEVQCERQGNRMLVTSLSTSTATEE